MPAFPLRRRVTLCVVAVAMALLSTSAFAQWSQGAFKYRWSGSVPIDEITPNDVIQALIWTGHYGTGLDKTVPTDPRQAAQSWQASKKYKITEELSDEQTVELVAEGLKKRDSVGWATLRDSAVGFEVGIPAKLVRQDRPIAQRGTLVYNAEGEICHTVLVDYGNPNCNDMVSYYRKFTAGATSRARLANGFASIHKVDSRVEFTRAACHPAGMVTAIISMPADMVPTHGVMFAALARSLGISSAFNPTARPRPKLEEPSFATMGMPDDASFRPASTSSTNKPKRDPSGQAEGLKLETKTEPDLRVDEVFDKVAGAVYIVKVDKGQGSAVAVTENTLLTNCHVVGEQTHVTLVREKHEMKAEVVSGKTEADRCVLRVESKLPSWVGVRPYDDIKVGERAVTVGTPFGFELTAADGIVSSKRTYRGSKLVQTSAPISPGSSGGGLFDARGNLLGITTFYVNVGQNLNFAVAAEEFVRQDRAD